MPASPPLAIASKLSGTKIRWTYPPSSNASDELPHAVIVRIRLQHLDVLNVPVSSSQQEHFGELRQVECRLKQAEISLPLKPVQ